MKFYEHVIDDFGGYEAAKKVAEDENAALIHNVGALKQHLLNYRCANNIFEAGDKVVLIGESEMNDIFEIKEISIVGHYWAISVNGGGYEYTFIKNQLRHATDEEIAQGHRS